eukprot:scaffold14533_cov118-Isochrysis_galbana.AAC.7
MPDFKWPGELHSIPPRATTPQLVQLSPDTPALFPSCSRPSNQMCRARLKRTDQRCAPIRGTVRVHKCEWDDDSGRCTSRPVSTALAGAARGYP